ncbi:MAG: mechanosensitive ion channel domain-containing protein [Rikenellaceae bacterium]
MFLANFLSANADTAETVESTNEMVMNFISKMLSTPSEEIISKIVSATTSLGLKIILAIAVYFVGRWIIKRINGICATIFEKRNFDRSLSKFIENLISITLTICLILTVIGILGINTTSFVAIFASAGLAVGMALSGTLQNFAGGVMILLLKPFKIGDVIEAQGFTGCVKEVSLFSTLLNTPDNKMVIIPNGPLSTGVVNNYSKETIRRVDWLFGVSYNSNFDFVSSVINDVVSKHESVLQDQEIFIGISNFSDSSVDIAVRAWTASADYWTLYFDINKAIFARFKEEGIEFPYPQMDVHMKSKM